MLIYIPLYMHKSLPTLGNETEQQQIKFYEKIVGRVDFLWKSEILVPYLNYPSEETIFASNKIKEQHETLKLQNEEVMLRNT